MLSIGLAGIPIRITFSGRANRIEPFYSNLYRKFLIPYERAHARLEVKLIDNAFDGLGRDRVPTTETRVGEDPLKRWLQERNVNTRECLAAGNRVGVRLLNGLLVYQPANQTGHIFLSEQDPRPFRPLYHLFWIFFAQVLGDHGACFLHAAGLEKENLGFVFFGESGAGKSTLSTMCGNCRILSDESPILAQCNGGFRIYPSPIHQFNPDLGPEEAAASSGLAVAGIFFLFRDHRPFVEPVSRKSAFAAIMERHLHHFQFLSGSAKAKLFDLLYGLCHKISANYLHFGLDTDIWDLITPGHVESRDAETGAGYQKEKNPL